LSDELAALEIQAQGRFGLYVLDTVSGAEAGWRGDERFPMCSTFKTLLAARMLYLAQRDEIRLWRKLYYSPSEVVAWSPISEKRAGANGGMTVQELCEAMVLVSDNTAANVLLEASGGPAALTQWLRELGDGTTRLDRNEPSLNTALAGDERDTDAAGHGAKPAEAAAGRCWRAMPAPCCSNGWWTAVPATSACAPACPATGRWVARQAAARGARPATPYRLAYRAICAAAGDGLSDRQPARWGGARSRAGQGLAKRSSAGITRSDQRCSRRFKACRDAGSALMRRGVEICHSMRLILIF
jgi:hypothetical protein